MRLKEHHGYQDENGRQDGDILPGMLGYPEAAFKELADIGIEDYRAYDGDTAGGNEYGPRRDILCYAGLFAALRVMMSTVASIAVFSISANSTSITEAAITRNSVL